MVLFVLERFLAIFSEDKDTEFFYLPETFCKFLMRNNKIMQASLRASVFERLHTRVWSQPYARLHTSICAFARGQTMTIIDKSGNYHIKGHTK